MSYPFLHNSLTLRIALPLVLIAPVFWFTGCVTPPAHPQAGLLPDNEVAQTHPDATLHGKMVEITLTEWDRWGRQVVRVECDDTYYVVGDGFPGQPQGRRLTPNNPMPTPSNEGNGTDMLLLEAVAEPVTPVQIPCLRYPDDTDGEATVHGCMLAKRYWGIIGKTPTCQQSTAGGWVWSATFTSWIMRETGLQNDQLPTSATHVKYVTSACDHLLRHPAFVLECTPAMPHLGGLTCTARGADHFMTDLVETQANRTPMHCDLVIEMDSVRHGVELIGDNMQQSVSINITELNDVNQLDSYTSPVMQWLAVLCNQLSQQTADVTLFNVRRKFINM